MQRRTGLDLNLREPSMAKDGTSFVHRQTALAAKVFRMASNQVLDRPGVQTSTNTARTPSQGYAWRRDSWQRL